jgi:hypothetical protein
MVVRRGHVETFDQLTQRFAMSGRNIEVIWDRRVGDRRHEHLEAADERRHRERRAPLPDTWDLVHFFVKKIV